MCRLGVLVAVCFEKPLEQGLAFVLAWEDYAPPGSDVAYCYRWLIREARTSLRESIGDVIRWLEGR